MSRLFLVELELGPHDEHLARIGELCLEPELNMGSHPSRYRDFLNKQSSTDFAEGRTEIDAIAQACGALEF